MYGFTPEILTTIVKRRRNSVLSCLIIVAFSALIFFASYPEYHRLGDAPILMATSQATDHADQRPWVTLTDAHWQCDQLISVAKDDSTYIRLSDPSNSKVIVAYYSGPVNCFYQSSFPPTGTIGRMSEKMLNRLVGGGLKITDSQIMKNDLYYMCTYCGRVNSFQGVVVALFLLLMAAVFYVLTEKFRQKSKSKDPFTATPSEIWKVGFIAFLFGGSGILLDNKIFLGIVPTYYFGLPIALTGQAFMFFSKNNLLIDIFTKNNYEFMVSVWGEEYFGNRLPNYKKLDMTNKLSNNQYVKYKNRK